VSGHLDADDDATMGVAERFNLGTKLAVLDPPRGVGIARLLSALDGFVLWGR
jgi:hypothetical protein